MANKIDRGEIPFNLYKLSSPGVARLKSNVRLTPDDVDDVRHIDIDLGGLNYRYLEGQSLGVLAPGTDEKGKPHKLRLYSIASTRLGDDRQGNSAALCVKRVVYNDPETGETRRGVASNFLCDLQPGDTVRVTGPAGKAFLLPPNPSSNLIMVATGTGIAPFRGFLKQIFEERNDWTGKVYLFFGVRTQRESLYQEELEQLAARTGYRLVLAFSREQKNPEGGRMYVQHRIAELAPEIWPLLSEESTFTYICGLKGMEAGIDAVLGEVASAHGKDWEQVRDVLADEGRYLVETY